MITHRCLERRLFLTPDSEEVAEHIGFCLAISLKRYGVKLHATCWMGNHHHTSQTDPGGKLPLFKNLLHSQVARGLNALRDRDGGFWDRAGSCDTRGPTDEESINDLVYILTNPVKAGLVKTGSRWAGFSTYGWRFGEVRRFRRSAWYFDPDNPDIPEYADITLERPAIMLHLSDDELYDLVMERVRERERRLQQSFAKKRRRFRGETKVGKQSWNRAPSTPGARFTVARRAAGSKWAIVALLQRDRDWEQRYARARKARREGAPYLFPYGTYWMRVYIGVQVADVDP